MLRFGALKTRPKSTWASGIYLAMGLHECCKDNVLSNGMMDGFKENFREQGTNKHFFSSNTQKNTKKEINISYVFSFFSLLLPLFTFHVL